MPFGEINGTITTFLEGIAAGGSEVGSKYRFLKASVSTAFFAALREDGVCTPSEVYRRL
ncbi:MAG: hypothetical protein NTY37_12690 [Methanothrix sp.]|nr:hypothetical protein [Methanothrix sp.]